MKTRIIFLMFAILFSGAGIAQEKGTKTKNSSVGSFQKIIKDVFYIDISKNTFKLSKKDLGKFLFNGDEIKTEESSIAVVKFTDGSALTVQPNSLITIHGKAENKGEKSTMEATTIVKKGSTYFNVKKQDSKSDFKFTTPTMVASIRGTAGLVKADNDSVNTFTVEEGLVYVEALKGTLENGNVAAGKTATVYADGKVVINDTEPETKRELERAKVSSEKHIIIKAANGDAKIYYKEDKK